MVIVKKIIKYYGLIKPTDLYSSSVSKLLGYILKKC